MDSGKGGAVQQFSYCPQCRRSIPPAEWKSHKYTSKHKKFVGSYAESVRKSIGAVLTGSTEEAARVFHCILCDWHPNEDAANNAISSCRKQVWNHLASPGHSKSLDRFIHECRSVISDLKKESLSLTATQVQKRVMELLEEADRTAREAEAASKAAPAPSNAPTGPLAPMVSPFAGPAKPQAPRTLVSRSGILQNPTGTHNGSRVWGGGIVRLNADEWLPWELDEKDSSGGVAQRPTRGEDIEPTEPRSVPLLHPEALGLTRISVPRTLGASQTLPGMLPGQAAAPWLQAPVSSTLATLVPHGGTLAQLADIYRQKMKNAKKNPNRVGAKWANERLGQIQQQILSSVHQRVEPNKKAETATATAAAWLPKFGGVWNEGPRSQHLRAFRENSDQKHPSK